MLGFMLGEPGLVSSLVFSSGDAGPIGPMARVRVIHMAMSR
jgi:hypothetical protein